MVRRHRALQTMQPCRSRPRPRPLPSVPRHRPARTRRRLHWAQLQTYGALFCRTRGLPEIALALVYFDVATQTEAELHQVYGAEELDEEFNRRCASFSSWASQEAAHRSRRDAALRQL